MTALGPAAVDDGTAGLGAHPDPEAVGAVTFGIARLKGSLAHGRFLL